MLTIAVLGPVAVCRDGEAQRLPAGKPTELLVRLAVEPGAVVPADRLIDDLWQDDAITTSRNTLQSKIATLRRTLGDSGSVVAVGDGYRLDLDPAVVDVWSVARDATAADELLRGGDARAAAAIATTAIGRFSGVPLRSAGDADWVEPHRARLAVVRRALLATACRARLALGDEHAVATELELEVAEHPYDEGLWVLLASALYRAGRPNDALAGLQRLRSNLRGDLGLDAGPDVAELERQILDHDGPLLHPASLGNLPALPVDLIGRDADLALLAGLLDAHRLVQLVGPGGVGKTALAVEVARRAERPGASWLVRLDGASSPTEVVDAAVATLGVAGGEGALVERLRSRPALLVVDNCEHVLEAASEWVARLLTAVPSLTVLSTSQIALEVDGGVVHDVDPLALPDAIRLFAERARRQRRTIDTDANAAHVASLCTALDGLPLAIELAAARTRTLAIDDIVRRLDDRFVVLSDPTSTRPPRRRALRATIAWSYDLLFPDDQRGLWALAPFAGGAPLDAIEDVMEALGVPHAAVIDVLGRLVARSLVLVDDRADGLRYRLLDSIRAFALEVAGSAGAIETVRRSHARWLREAAARSTAGVRSADQAVHLAQARVERENIDVALAWCAVAEPRWGLDLASGFGWAWVVLGDARGGERLHAALDACGDSAPRESRAAALLLAGWIEASTGHLDPAANDVTAARDLARQLGDVELEARAAYFLAYIASHRGDFAEGLALTQESGRLFARLQVAPPWDVAANALFALRAATSAGEVDRAVIAAAEVEHRLALVDDPWLHVRGEAMFGELARLQHRFGDAVAHLSRAAATSAARGYAQTEAYQVASLGRAQVQAGDPATGAATLELAVGKAESIGDVRMAALARVHLGRVLRGLERDDEARTTLRHAVDWHRREGGGEQALLGECLAAAVDLVDGDASAAVRIAEILSIARQRSDAPVEVFALDALALAAAPTDPGAAGRLLAEADERMHDASHFVAPCDRADARSARRILDRAARQGATATPSDSAPIGLGDVGS